MALKKVMVFCNSTSVSQTLTSQNPEQSHIMLEKMNQKKTFPKTKNDIMK